MLRDVATERDDTLNSQQRHILEKLDTCLTIYRLSVYLTTLCKVGLPEFVCISLEILLTFHLFKACYLVTFSYLSENDVYHPELPGCMTNASPFCVRYLFHVISFLEFRFLHLSLTFRK